MDLDHLPPEKRREALTAWLDGEATPEEARRIEAWLAAHPEEAARVARLRRTWDLLSVYGDEPVPEGFAERVLASAGREGVGGARPRLRLLSRWKPLAAAAAVAALAFVAGRGLLKSSGDEAPAGAESALLLETLPPDLLEQADLLLTLSEEEFSTLLEIDPEEVAGEAQGG
jgi:anti-sigma factor RsiW